MRTRSQPQSPGGLVSLSDKPRARPKRSRDERVEELPAKRHATATFLNVRARARAHEAAASKNEEPRLQPPELQTQHVMTTPASPESQNSSPTTSPTPRNDQKTHPQTPNTAGRNTLFGSMFGSISRSVSRLFTTAPEITESTTSDDPSNETLQLSPEKLGEIETPKAKPITLEATKDEYGFAPTPSIGTRRSVAQSEPRPRRSLFGSTTTPRNYSSYRNAASARKSKTPMQRRQDTRQLKQHLWKLGWEGVPLNRITDPRSLKQREEEAREAGINLAEYEIYDPGYGPSDKATEPEDARDDDAVPGQKRKRQPPSPDDYIPNPPGVSYGMDLRYFDNSDTDEAEEEEVDPVAKFPKSALKKATDNSFERIARSSKRVKFDNSPIDTPSKERARARYGGIHFSDSPNAFVAAEQQSSPTSQNSDSFVPSSAHPAPNRFCMPDEWSDESSLRTQDTSSGMSGIEYGGEPSTFPDDSTFLPQSESSTFIPRETPLPETPRKSKAEDASPLSKARQSAERYKPKSPSALRQSTQLSSSVSSISSMAPEKAQVDDIDDEDNEFSKLDWPIPPTMVEAGICTQEIADLVDALWSPSDDARAEEWFDREFAKFQAAEAAVAAAASACA